MCKCYSFGKGFLTYRLFYFSGAGKFCLAHGLRKLTLDIKSDVSRVQTLVTRRNEDLRMTFGVGRRTTLIVKILFITIFREYVRKIINHRSPMQTEKSQPVGQRIIPETRFPASSVYHWVGISLSASETDDRFYLS